jgi:hypothetical protein
MSIQRLSFVYDADGTLAGEVRYYLGSLIGRAHCALCDITHSKVGKRTSFRRCAQDIGVPITYLHRDDVPADVVAAAGGQWPAVVGHHHDGAASLLLDREALERCAGSTAQFQLLLTAALEAT